MLNYLRNGSLKWSSSDCEERFYAALQSPNHKEFRHLYKAHKEWQLDLTTAITYCLHGLEGTGVTDRGLDCVWVPTSESGCRVNIRSNEHNWIGFLRDTEDCCTMAVFEGKCLVLPALTQISTCRAESFKLQPPLSSPSDHHIKKSVLQTSFMLNENAVPESMHPVRLQGHHGSKARHDYRWSSSQLKQGTKFFFGANGQLKAVDPLGNGQILVEWESLWIDVEALKRKVLASGSVRSEERQHREYIRDEKGSNGPVNVLVISSVAQKTTASSIRLGKRPMHLHSTSNTNLNRQYHYDSSVNYRPREYNQASILRGSNMDQWRAILNRWRRGEKGSLDGVRRAGLMERIARLVAGLPSHIEHNDEENGAERDSVEEV